MASVLKKQILKQLSRFTKGLKEEDINISTFKGEGELSYLELDENALMDVLDVPYWIKITSAKCDRVFVQVPFMTIKKVPITLTLDKVSLEVETCENVEEMAMHENIPAFQPGKYKFINQIIDGITIQINEVNITFKDPAFKASLQILKVLVQSKSPNWELTNLKTTRLKNEQKTQILIFKELTWQMIRIELYPVNDRSKPPIKLFTNDIICRLTIKKRLSDCFILGCKLAILIEELLCVFTDSQMKAALHYIDSIAGIVQRSMDLSRKNKALRKLECLPEYQAQLDQQKRGKFVSSSKSSCLFSFHDVIETSYHFVAQKVFLHLSDDPGSRSLHPELQNGGSIQIEVNSFQIDLYPYHLAESDRLHWGLYKKASSSFFQWLKDSQNEFWAKLYTVVQEKLDLSDDSASKLNIARQMKKQYSKLMTSCTVLRVSDFTVFRVQTGKKQDPIHFIKSDKECHKLPSDSKVIHAEFTYYYYPGDIAFPLPPSKFYVQLNPVQLNFDNLTIIWLNTFALNVYKSLMTTNVANQENLGNMIYIDILIEAIMPRIIFEESKQIYSQKDRPKSLNLQTSRATISNIRNNEQGMSRTDLSNCINNLQLSSLFYTSEYPVKKGDCHPITQKFIDHAQGKDDIRKLPNVILGNSLDEFMNELTQELLWIEAKDVWCIRLDPVWGDFYGARAVGSYPVPFLEAFPLTLWIELPTLTSKTEKLQNVMKHGDITVLCDVSNLISIQINHYQYLFLMRIADIVDELTTYVIADQHNIIKDNKNGSFVLAALITQVEITFVTNAIINKIGGVDDISSSVVIDSSSIATQSGHSVQLSNVVQTTYEDVGYVYDMSQSLKMPLAISTTNVNVKHKEFISNKSASVVYDNLKEMSQIKMAESVTNDINLPSFKGMKKRWFTFGASIDVQTKQNDDFNDNVSVRSDLSSDSESLLDLSLDTVYGADVIFRFPSSQKSKSGISKNIEFAAEAFDDIGGGGELTPPTTSSERDSIGSSIKRKDLISITTLKLGRVEVVHQSKGLNSIVKVQITNIDTDECPCIPWDEFQDKFITRTRDWNEVDGVEGVPQLPQVMLRLEHDIIPHFDVKSIQNSPWKNDQLSARINNISLSLNSCSLTNLGDFFLDEQPSKPPAFEATIENTKILFYNSLLQNDSQGAIKLSNTEICLNKLKIKRTKDGLICIEPNLEDYKKTNDCDDQLLKVIHESKKLSIENEYLYRKLATLERLKKENFELKKLVEENKNLKYWLNSAQDNISKLLEEKQNLLDQVQNIKDSKTHVIVASKR
ncbi:UHRF1-binding protein 1-like [Daktulosphaira vitifoliae]|uniref:UHRF1-binding protein 1-like n=1 Tax=Daktulosphaira vitifoliae TaxID=58002 RepID=UPI0021AAE711|nr:UHRF1-binding protein 1-like [Daktulosphaira vitifoliae]